MALFVYWFLLALVLLGVEMATGTFYLLVLAIAAAVGGVAALLGLGVSIQYAFASFAGVVGIFLLRRWKPASGCDVPSQNLDVGQPVKVLVLHDDGTARVAYRGAEWDAELEGSASAHKGVFYIKAIRGSMLVLTHHKPG